MSSIPDVAPMNLGDHISLNHAKLISSNLSNSRSVHNLVVTPNYLIISCVTEIETYGRKLCVLEVFVYIQN